jgi:hypothetical protein
MTTAWRRLLVEQMIADLHQALMKQFRHEGHFVGPPASVTKAIGRAFHCLDDDDLERAERFCSVAEHRIIDEGVALRSDPEAWLRQQCTGAAK